MNRINLNKQNPDCTYQTLFFPTNGRCFEKDMAFLLLLLIFFFNNYDVLFSGVYIGLGDISTSHSTFFFFLHRPKARDTQISTYNQTKGSPDPNKISAIGY